MKKAAWVLLGLLPATASADEVFLKGGGRIAGVVVETTATRLTLEVGPGRITLPLSRVIRIVEGRSSLAVFRERAAALGPGDAAGWLQLAVWAEERGLGTQARAAYEKVLAIDPGNAEAQRGLGNVRLADRWVTPEESYRAQGLVPFEGQWMTPAEREALVRERTEAAAGEQLRREAEARTREAEARARAAEAEAQRAEAAAREAAEVTSGIPFFPVFGRPFFGSLVVAPHRSFPPLRPQTQPRPERRREPPSPRVPVAGFQ